MARIKDAAVFINTEVMDLELEDIVEIVERPAKHAFIAKEYTDFRDNKRNGKRRSHYHPPSYRHETKIQIFLLDEPRRAMVPLRSSF